MPSWSGSVSAPGANARCPSVHRVPAGRHAGGEGAIVVAAPLGQGVLLLGHVALLLLPLLLLHLLLFLHVPTAPHHAEEASHAGADGRALPRIAADGAAHRPERGTAEGSPEHPALRSL